MNNSFENEMLQINSEWKSNSRIYGEVIEYNKVGTLKFKNEGINYLFFNYI